MKPCRQCGTANDEAHKFCRQCGRPLDAGVAPAGNEETVRWTAGLPRGGGLRQTVPLDALFAGKRRALVGRAPECDVCLPHPTVSRHHAVLEWQPPDLRLRDLGSRNGVLVGGRPIAEPVRLQEHERVGIGPYLFCLSAGVIHFLDSSQSLRLEAHDLEQTVVTAAGKVRKLLEGVNLAVEPGEFVSLLGPSGSGKSTLMDCLNGRRPASGGRVLANGEDFYRHFDSFRMSLGYVPQRDIVHAQLPVYRALYYTARLRLPTDTGPAELRARVEEVLKLMELEAHRDTVVGQLSGGQIKRVSLGAELLARPCLLYIDEATSGLDAGTEARMMALFRQLADEGRSVICITHNVDNVDRCNLVLVLARGRLVYFGPPQEARAYFGVSRVSEVYDRLASKEPERWAKEFAGCSLYRDFVANRLGGAAGSGSAEVAPAPLPGSGQAEEPSLSHSSASILLAEEVIPPPRAQRPPLWHQFRILTTRYLELIGRDRYGLRLLLFQAPVVSLFILLGFVNKPYQEKVLAPRALTPAERQGLMLLSPAIRRAYEMNRAVIARFDPKGRVEELVRTLEDLSRSDGPVVPVKMIVNPSYTYILLFLIVLIVLWFGCNNASKEIVKEEAIYGRERAVNLGILPYLASKFLVMGLLTVLQALVLMAIIYGVLDFLGWKLGHPVPEPAYYLPYLPQFGVLALLALTGVAMGLLLSACVATPDRANALLPYVLIPQIILGGGILAIRSGPLLALAVLFSPAYWAYRAIHTGVHTVLPEDLPWHMDYEENPWLPVVALTVQMVVLLLLTAWFLRQKDVRRA